MALFPCNLLGEPSSYLKINTTMKNDESIFLDQEVYIKRTLKEFQMHESRPVATPHEPNQKRIDDSPASQAPYRNAVGYLMHLSNSTRPDITEAVNSASINMINPTESDWANIKRIFRYLKGTSDLAYSIAQQKLDMLMLTGVMI
jgi:hypothetical protein